MGARRVRAADGVDERGGSVLEERQDGGKQGCRPKNPSRSSAALSAEPGRGIAIDGLAS
ncbi:MAG: hypothetical protein LC729_02900 [Acidobacteria bacterium]|nr:hypothetical protein [Acidobacteriota bacterium]